jgi:hypothetical protein
MAWPGRGQRAQRTRVQGVTDLATVNTKDFVGLGFVRVWNPLRGP